MATQATKDRAKGIFTSAMRRLFPFAPTTPKATKELLIAQWAGLADAIIAAAVELIGTGGTGGGSVNSVNNQTPDEEGNVTLTASNVGALATGGTAADSSKLGGSAASAYEKTANKGAANGYAPLGADALIPTAYLPPLAIEETYVVDSQAAQLALTTQRGDAVVRTDIAKTYVALNDNASKSMADYQEFLATGQVTSVNGQTGVVSIVAAPAVEAGKIIRGKSDGTTWEASDTLPDDTKTKTQSPGTNNTTVATCAFVADAVATITGDVKFTPSSDISTILAALASATIPKIIFADGTYDFGANNVVLEGEKTIETIGFPVWKVDKGKSVRSKCYNDGAYWAVTDAVRAFYWDSANSRFVKRSNVTLTLPTISSSSEGYYMTIRDRIYLIDHTDVANSYIYITETPKAVQRFDANSDTEMQYVAIFKPTKNLSINGNLRIEQNSGAPEVILHLVGLLDSAICYGPKAPLRLYAPSGSGVAAGAACIGLVADVFNCDIGLDVRKTNTTNSSCWWVWTQYTFNSRFIENGSDIELNYAGSSSGDHLFYHNTHTYGCFFDHRINGVRTSTTAGATPVTRGVDYVYYEDITVRGHIRDVESAVGTYPGTNAYCVGYGTCYAGTGSSYRNAAGLIATNSTG